VSQAVCPPPRRKTKSDRKNLPAILADPKKVPTRGTLQIEIGRIVNRRVAARRESSRKQTVENARPGLFAFDPAKQVSLDPFVDIIGRNFRNPPEGLGYDGSPVAHMWRTMMFPKRPL
jgi:hypothetical protein